jgi:RimJ/RimL family protein N-acetyltransferase
VNPEDQPVLETARLSLRAWQDADLAEFARMNADPRVMEFMSRRLTRDESDALDARVRDHLAEHGFGWWAVSIKGGAPFIGCVGLLIPNFSAAFTPCVEIGWRLVAEHWGRGYATEVARAVLTYGFSTLELEEIVSFTTEANSRSRRVMEKLGLKRDPAEDFDHPELAADHPLRRHVLYRVSRDVWQ